MVKQMSDLHDTVIRPSASHPRVSVILPTYNRAGIIATSIDSVLLQSYTDWELIICDDCSTDGTENVCRRYSAEKSNIRYVRSNARNGLPKNRNVGLKHAQGEIIFFIEDDLVLTSDCLGILVATYDSLKIDGSLGGIAPRLLEKNRKVYPNKEPFILNKLTGEITNNYTICPDNISEVITLHACSMYTKTLLETVGGYEEEAYIGNFVREETDLNFRIKRLGYKFYFQPDAIAHHNQVRAGGCRTGTLVRREIYTFRNHVVFLSRIFGLRCLYMIPFYIASYSLQFVGYVFRATLTLIRHH